MPRIPLGAADARSKHVERVLTNADAHSSAASDDEMVASWRRSANTHSVDPASGEAPRILTTNELTALREPLAKLLVEARSELDRLFSVVRHTHYVVLLCDQHGVAIEHRGEEALGDQFRFWGPWLGGVWSEEVEGTNGIGTCIAEKRPITVHLSQHFRARHIALSCSGAPIFDCDGEVAAVLDVTSIDPQLSERSHAITGALTEVSARAIEERWFRDRFRRECRHCSSRQRWFPCPVRNRRGLSRCRCRSTRADVTRTKETPRARRPQPLVYIRTRLLAIPAQGS
jgi:transcriptional regulator of acetoin/glycerol metabolism